MPPNAWNHIHTLSQFILFTTMCIIHHNFAWNHILTQSTDWVKSRHKISITILHRKLNSSHQNWTFKYNKIWSTFHYQWLSVKSKEINIECVYIVTQTSVNEGWEMNPKQQTTIKHIINFSKRPKEQMNHLPWKRALIE